MGLLGDPIIDRGTRPLSISLKINRVNWGTVVLLTDGEKIGQERISFLRPEGISFFKDDLAFLLDGFQL
jgi:hypothetical protein